MPNPTPSSGYLEPGVGSSEMNTYMNFNHMQLKI